MIKKIAIKLSVMAFGICTFTLMSQAVLADADLFFVNDITECTQTTQDDAMDVRNLALGSTAPVLMTEANNCVKSWRVTNPYEQYFDDIWGADDLLPRVYAVPGNHAYMTGIDQFEDYFGYDTEGTVTPVPNSNWAIVRIDTNFPGSEYGGMSTREWYYQKIWLNTILANYNATGKTCALVYGHFPRFSSGGHQDDENLPEAMQEIWEILYDHGVELYLSGHDHHYERMYPMDVDGNRVSSPGVGVTQMIVGTGGATLRGLDTIHENSAVRITQKHGLLEIFLYDWWWEARFVDTNGVVQDSSYGYCYVN
jgi:hypothetical protein